MRNSNKKRRQHNNLLFRYTQFVLLPFAGQTGKQYSSSLDGFLGTLCVQDIAKLRQNFSEGDGEIVVTTKIPTYLSYVPFTCVLDSGDTFGMTVGWLLQTVP